MAIEDCAASLTAQNLVALFQFMISRALGDLDADVRQGFIDAGTKLVQVKGESEMGTLLPLFEACLAGFEQ